MNEAPVADPVDTLTVPEPIQPTVTAPVGEPDTLQSTMNALTNVPEKTAKSADSGRKKKSSGNTTVDGEALTQCLDASPIATVPPVAEGFTRTLGYAVRYGSFVNCYGVAQWDRVSAYDPLELDLARGCKGSDSTACVLYPRLCVEGGGGVLATALVRGRREVHLG